MFSFRNLFSILFALNALAIIVVWHYASTFTERQDTSLITKIQTRIKFNDPVLAYHTLRKLDVYQEISDEFYELYHNPRPQYDQPYLGLKQDDEYCSKVWAYVVDHPDSVFDEKNFFSEYIHDSMVRAKIIPMVGTDVMPFMTHFMAKDIKKSRNIDRKSVV